jgi:hypothetical protein
VEHKEAVPLMIARRFAKKGQKLADQPRQRNQNRLIYKNSPGKRVIGTAGNQERGGK